MHNSQCTMRGRLKAKKICANRCTENFKKLLRMDLSRIKQLGVRFRYHP